MEASNTVMEQRRGYMHIVNERMKYGRPRKEWIKSDIDLIWEHIGPDCRVLDYGCGNGSIGFLGTDEQLMIQVVGLDEFDLDNMAAKYHNRSEVEGTFNLIVARHVIEHMDWGADGGELRRFLEWCYNKSNKLITVSPNPNRYYSFREDPTHKTECNTNFYLALCESVGWQIKDVVLADVRLGSKVFFLPRLALSLFEGVAPLFSHIVIMEKTV